MEITVPVFKRRRTSFASFTRRNEVCVAWRELGERGEGQKKRYKRITCLFPATISTTPLIVEHTHSSMAGFSTHKSNETEAVSFENRPDARSIVPRLSRKTACFGLPMKLGFFAFRCRSLKLVQGSGEGVA
ncbi:hypothetical protein ACS0TY_023251 [Phlomoides rotata]